MKTLFRFSVLSAFFWTLAVTSTSAADIAYFKNGDYVDLDGEFCETEGLTLEASLISLGHNVIPFTDISAAGWTTALSNIDLLVLPEMEQGDLEDDLSPEAIAIIQNYVSSGGGIISHGLFGNLDFLNQTFGFSIISEGSSDVYTLNASQASGTAFEGGPMTINDNNATDLLTGSLPAGKLCIYENGDGTSVAVLPYGNGNIVYMGWDWFQCRNPGRGADPDWDQVLDNAVETIVALSIPTMGQWALFILFMTLSSLGVVFLWNKRQVMA